MEVALGLLSSLIEVTSIWSIIGRGVVWMLIAGVIIMSADNPRPDQSGKKLKRNLGFVLMFLVLSGTLVYMLFGYTPAPL